MKNTVCFIHSCTILHTNKLEYLFEYFDNLSLIKRFKHIYIFNNGENIDVNKYQRDNVTVINYSNRTDLYENTTIKLLHFYSTINPNDKILYLHTKGIGYNEKHPFYRGVCDWIDFMLYNLVNHYDECVQMLDYVDTVGCNYRPNNTRFNLDNPDHYSGNFWWANASYIKTIDIFAMNDKYDAEWFIFRKQPLFVNIASSHEHHYELPYPREMYKDMVDNNVVEILYNLRNPDKINIYYGTDNEKYDVTAICIEKLLTVDEKGRNIITIPCGDMERNNVFTDPIVGIVKKIYVNKMEYEFKHNVKIVIDL